MALCQLFLLRIFFFLTSKTAKFLTAKMVPSVSFLFCTVVTYDNYWSVASGTLRCKLRSVVLGHLSSFHRLAFYTLL